MEVYSQPGKNIFEAIHCKKKI